MRILLTGANGFIGQAIAAELPEKSNEILAVGRPRTKNSNPNTVREKNYFKADISKESNLEEIAKIGKIDVVIHCAGLAHQFGNTKKEEFWKANVTGTENVVNTAVKLNADKIIVISSVAVYGGMLTGENEVTEENVCRPQEIYAASKLESEKIAQKICRENKILLTILRPSTVIGENDRGNFMRLIERIDQNRFFWIGKGINRKSLIYKSEVARACRKILFSETNSSEIYNISDEAISMKEVVDEIARELNKKIPSITISEKLMERFFKVNNSTFNIKKINNLEQTVRKWLADDVYSGEKFRKDYDFQVKVSVKDAIKREVSWYQAGKNV